MDFSFEKNVASILHMYLGGQAVGESVADLISGEVNPSGKLAETIPFSEKILLHGGILHRRMMMWNTGKAFLWVTAIMKRSMFR